jgi:hypothetical protein
MSVMMRLMFVPCVMRVLVLAVHALLLITKFSG